MRKLPSSLRVALDIGIPSAIFAGLFMLGGSKPHLWDEGDSVGELWMHRIYLMSLWLTGSVVFARVIGSLVLEGIGSTTSGRPIPRIFHDILIVACLIAAILGILNTVFGVPLGAFWTASGIISVVLGLALRPIILDFFSGLGANIENAYKLGDWITIHHNGIAFNGWIEEINWRTLRIRTRDGFIMLLPNSVLATCAVINHAMPTPESRFRVSVRIDVAVPVERATRILISAANSACALPNGPQTSPAPDIIITEASNRGIEYTVRYWFDPSRLAFEVVNSVVFSCIAEHLSKAGIPFAHPKENVFLSRLPRADSGFKDVEDRVAFLRKVDLFEALSDANLRFLGAELRVRTIGAAQMLVRAGDSGDSMFILAEGVLRVLSKPEGGNPPVELATLQPGDVLGERSLLTGEPRSASVVAVTECIVLEIAREDLQQLITREPGVLETLERTIAERQESSRKTFDQARARASLAEHGKTQFLIERMRQLFRRGD